MKRIGKGNIIVNFKSNSGLQSITVECHSIEIYGEKLCFSDEDGELIRYGTGTVQVTLDQVLRIVSNVKLSFPPQFTPLRH